MYFLRVSMSTVASRGYCRSMSSGASCLNGINLDWMYLALGEPSLHKCICGIGNRPFVSMCAMKSLYLRKQLSPSPFAVSFLVHTKQSVPQSSKKESLIWSVMSAEGNDTGPVGGSDRQRGQIIRMLFVMLDES